LAAGGKEEEEGVKLNLNLPFAQLSETNLFLQLHTAIEQTACRLTINNRRKREAVGFNPSMAEIVDEFARVEIGPEDRGIFKSGVAFGLMIVLQQKDMVGAEFREFLAAKAANIRSKIPEALKTDEAIVQFEKERDPRRGQRIRRDP
jgi:hypothetical protein